MDIDFRSGEICLQHNEPLTLSDARDLNIVCTNGTVWITADGEAGDTFLHPKESFSVRGKGMVLVESLGSAKIRLTKPPRSTVWRKVNEAAMRLYGKYNNRLIPANH